MNKKLLIVVVVLLIGAVISFRKETNFSFKEKEVKEKVMVLLKDDNKNYLLDDYLYCVLGGEMPASFNDEALKAQVVAIRSYTLYQLSRKGFLTNADQSCYPEEKLREVWGESYDYYSSRLKDIITSTNNEVMYYNDDIIKAYYFALSNGYTNDSITVFNEELPYIKRVESSFDKEQKKYEVETVIPIKEFQAKLNLENVNNINILKDEYNYVTEVTINESSWDGITLRKLLSLRSASFDIKKNQDNIIITTYGYGHGVGMSQYGANYLAGIGYDYQAILNYYYNDIKIKSYVY